MSRGRLRNGLVVSAKRDMQRGQLCFDGSRMTVAAPLSFALAGYTVDEIAREYPQLGREQIEAVTELAFDAGGWRPTEEHDQSPDPVLTWGPMHHGGESAGELSRVRYSEWSPAEGWCSECSGSHTPTHFRSLPPGPRP